MKAFLMHADRDFEFEREPPANEGALIQDLELDTLLSTMAAGDRFMFDVSRRALLLSLPDPDAIAYRQQVMTDCLEQPAVVRELYALAGEALSAQKTVWWSLRNELPRRTLGTAVQRMELFSGFLRRLHAMAEEHAPRFSSPGFRRFFAMLREELDDAYLALIESQLKTLKFSGGMLISAELMAGSKGKAYTLRRPQEQGFLGRIFDRSGYTFTIPDRDVNGFTALGTLEDKGTNLVANALAQSVDHVDGFFVMLRTELAFYVACLNLSDRLAEQGEPTAFPIPVARDERVLSARGLYDICLALTTGQRVVGNDVDAEGKSLVMITGANQGGKSTFLRSVGLAQLMTQSGMFVGAQSLRVNVCDGVFTHYKREEDETMESGKLDEELARMSAIASHVTANCILLCNESFASTNEREGSQIARQVVRALLDERVKVVFVTHMFDLVDGFHRQKLDTALFLRAERGSDGERSFKLSPGAPLPTSYGEDSYRKIFGASVETAQAN
jgi:DNA mismatch repair ATPase MutS